MICNKTNRYDARFENMPEEQDGAGRHRSADCAYEKGYEDGLSRKEQLNLDLGS